jgi:hypothetical protein
MTEPVTRLQGALDPEPSRIPQLDSVRAELRALGDLKVGS